MNKKFKLNSSNSKYSFQKILIAALILIGFSPFACGYVLDKNSDEDIFPVGIYINYGAPRKIAYLENGMLTKFDAPPNMRDIESLRGLGFDSCDALAFCLNKVYLIKPTGEKTILMSGNIELVNVTKYGLMYFDFNNEALNFADYKGKRTIITETASRENIITSVSPDGRKILCYLDGKKKFLITDGEKRSVFDADIDKNETVGVSYIFNNGSFIYTAVSDDKTEFHYSNTVNTSEIISFTGEAKSPKAYFNKQGNEALILINDALFKVNNRGEATFISAAAKSGKFGKGFVHLIPNNVKSETLCLNTAYIYDNGRFNNFYYYISDNPLYIDYKRNIFNYIKQAPYFVTRDYGYSLDIYNNKLLYEDEQANLCIDKYENGKLTEILKIDDIQGSYHLNQNLERGYLNNDAHSLNLYYFNNSKANLVRENILINNSGYSADGRCAAIRATDNEGTDNFVFYKDGKVSAIIGDDKIKSIICTVYDEVKQKSYIGEDEVYYIDGFDRLMKWSPENGKEVLLKKVGWYAVIPAVFPNIESMNDSID